MTPMKNRYDALDVEKNLLELVKIEYAMKKHFVYIDNIDELRHNEHVIRDFDHALRVADTLLRNIRNFRNNLSRQ